MTQPKQPDWQWNKLVCIKIKKWGLHLYTRHVIEADLSKLPVVIASFAGGALHCGIRHVESGHFVHVELVAGHGVPNMSGK